MNDIYLVSTELKVPYKPLKCNIIRRLKNKFRNDLALVQLSTPLPMEVYNTQHRIDEVILASRFEGDTLFPMPGSPVPVYICSADVSIDQGDGMIKDDKLHILDWGKVYKQIEDGKSGTVST